MISMTSTVKDVLDALREIPDNATRGLKFEALMVRYFKLHPVLSTEYDEVMHWTDWAYNGGRTDTGIDIVARNRANGSWTAVQCKFYDESRKLYKADVDSFFTESGRNFTTEAGAVSFKNRIIISTADWSKNAEEALADQTIPVQRISMADIADAPVDWDIVYPPEGGLFEVELTRQVQWDPKPHQRTAIDKTLAGFEIHDRGKLIMACGTGKTFTSLRFAEEFAAKLGGRARVLFAVPSIALLGQTLREWTQHATMDLRPFAVCSDKKVSKEVEDIKSYDIEIPVTTDGKKLAAAVNRGGKRFKGLQVVFTTYQSMEVINAAQEAGAPEFDLIICDEAHRTTGVTLLGEEPSAFTRVHDEDFIKGTKRLYMTATPRLFDDSIKDKAESHSAELCSMDDEAIYGPDFHRLGFGEAVEKGLLTDYKVLVLAVDEGVAARTLQQSVANSEGELTLDSASKIIGCWNGLAKRSGSFQGTQEGFEDNAAPMRRAVAFAKDIKTSQEVADQFPLIAELYANTMQEKATTDNTVSALNLDLAVEAKHVDGTMNAPTRTEKLRWLKDPTTAATTTRILTNARCLSEGVDVPALDAVLFLNPRNSVVDVVQSVGRVMRLAEGKKYGYIILPVGVPAGVAPTQALNDNKRFKVVWQVLNALRAHDDRFNAIVNSANLNAGVDSTFVDEKLRDKVDIDLISDAEPTAEQKDEAAHQFALFSLKEWQEAMYTRIVNKVGNRTYWEDWADDVADITQTQITRIKASLEVASPELKREFDIFVEGLRGNLNDSITEEDAVSMLSQHLITAPVFNALFSDYNFAEHNAVSRVMQRMVDAFSDQQLDKELEQLEGFYRSVAVRASEVTSASGKQQVVKDLYERFFRKAFKKQSEALGIVYTPVEVVDFILRAADELSQKHFGKGLSDEGVCILDPFAGTSTFMVRLLQSGLIKPEDLARKYAGELFATEIMLLAYYVSTVNIEATFNALRTEEALRNDEPKPNYIPFDGIALADTFQIHEDGDILDLTVFKNNNERIERQKSAPINVIVGNPPYSAGQTSANDLNANLKYPTLDARIAETYAAKSTATNKNSLYDSYLRAFRWATDRIQDQGIVAFVSNGGWIDANTGDGVRLSMAEDFTDVYVFNLRGNQRTAGEQSRKEGGKVFGSGSRSTIAITIAIKDTTRSGFNLHYRDIGDYLSAQEKLDIVNNSSIATIGWANIIPNEAGDWLSQRSADFGTWPVIGEKKGTSTKFFGTFSAGLKTGRDAWAYAQTPKQLKTNLGVLTDTYAKATERLQMWLQTEGITKPKEADVTKFLQQHSEFADTTKISWTAILKNLAAKGSPVTVKPDRIYNSLYRPFTGSYAYFDPQLNDRRYQLPSMFPTPKHANVGFVTVSPGETAGTATLATTLLPDLHTLATSQFFPRFTWEATDSKVEGALFGAVLGTQGAPEASIYGEIGEVVDGYMRVDNITDEIKKIYRDALGSDISGDDIFHFVYGKLHDPGYREAYAADLKKMLPHIQTPATRTEFDKFAAAGTSLMALHVGYEDVEPWPVSVSVKGDESERETWRVVKPKWAKKKEPETGKSVDDVTTMIYNKFVTIEDIPAEADEYMLGSRSALAWIIDRYQVKKDKASGIVNDPNDWADEVGNPRYIVDLIAKVARVAMETTKIVKGLK